MVNLETELQFALAERASTVPGTIAEHLCAKRYRARGAYNRSAFIAASLACAAAATGGIYAGTQAHGTSRAPASETVGLDEYSVTLTGRAYSRGRDCGRAPSSGRPEAVTQAGGFFGAYGGACLHIALGPARVPADTARVKVGTYHGYLRMQPATGTITLYIDGSTKNWLVFTTTHAGLSARQLTIAARQLVALAARSIPPCSPRMEYAPPCATG
jgi:hypothetical protein